LDFGAHCVECGEDVGGFRANAGVGASFGEEDSVAAVDDEDAREWETPAGFGSVVVAEAGVVKGDVDEDGLEVAAVFRWDGVSDAEFFCYGGAGVGEQGIGEAVLLEGEVVLAGGLGRDGDEERAAAAEVRAEVTPGFEFGDAVGVPAAAEEADYERAEGYEVDGADGFVGARVFEGEGRGLGSGFEDAVFDASVEEVFGCFFGDGETFGLDEGAGVLGDAVELVL
jgi:hypothetical protein